MVTRFASMVLVLLAAGSACAESPVSHRGKLRVHEFIDQDPLYWGLRTEFLNDRFTHTAVDRNLLGIYYRPQRPWRASQPTRRAKNFAGSFFWTDVIDGHSLLSCRDSNSNSISILCVPKIGFG